MLVKISTYLHLLLQWTNHHYNLKFWPKLFPPCGAKKRCNTHTPAAAKYNKNPPAWRHNLSHQTTTTICQNCLRPRPKFSSLSSGHSVGAFRVPPIGPTGCFRLPTAMPFPWLEEFRKTKKKILPRELLPFLNATFWHLPNLENTSKSWDESVSSTVWDSVG